MVTFMFHFGRCGSTVLTNCLNQSNEIFWHGEIFSRNVFISPGFQKSQWSAKKGNGIFTLDEFIGYIKFCISESNYKSNGAKHYGCEIKSYHFEYGFFQFSLVECLERLKVEFSSKFIYLERKNSMKRILSSIIAAEKDVWHVTKEVEFTNKIVVDIEKFSDVDLHFSGHVSEVCDNSDKKNMDYRNAIISMEGMCLEYEVDIDNSSLIGFYKLVKFLNIKEFKPTIKFMKTNPYPLSEIIVNYEKVLPFIS